MLFDLLIKSGFFQDEEYNQLTIENLPQNEVNNVVDSIVSSSRENTPEPSPASSQDDEEDIVVPALTDEDIERLVGTLNSMESQINSLLQNIKNYDDLSEAFEEDVEKMPSICHIKRKNVYEEEPVYEQRSNVKIPKLPDNDPLPRIYDSSDEEEEEEKQSGGKRTRHRKRKHNKNKTKKIKHAKKHTKKHKKHMKKHTKKH